MGEFEDQYKVCMELIKQKSREVSETDIITNCYERPIKEIGRRRKEGRGAKEEKEMPLLQFYYFTLLSCIIVLIINNIIKILLTISYFKALFKVDEKHIADIFSISVYVEEGIRSKIHGFLIHFV